MDLIELTKDSHRRLIKLIDKDKARRRHIRVFVEGWG